MADIPFGRSVARTPSTLRGLLRAIAKRRREGQTYRAIAQDLEMDRTKVIVLARGAR